jgi:hypothetical protein
VLGWPVLLDCPDEELFPYVESLYGGLRPAEAEVEERFVLTRGPDNGSWRGECGFAAPTELPNRAAILSWLDDQLTVGAQHRRSDLLFVHAAALGRHGRAVLLVAESGGGKSTTSWAALHHGFTLLSDELAPVDPFSLDVHAHPRAVCLKARPPDPYVLPSGTMQTSGGYYIASRLLPAPPAREPLPLGALVFVTYRPDQPQPTLRPISPAEGAVRLYAHCLNPLAHGGDGLDAAIAISDRAPAFVLHSGDLARTSALLASVAGP